METLRDLFCRMFHGHRHVMWPVRGEYFCRKCGLAFKVKWDEREA